MNAIGLLLAGVMAIQDASPRAEVPTGPAAKREEVGGLEYRPEMVELTRQTELGDEQAARGRPAEAEGHYRKAIEAAARVLPEDDPRVADLWGKVGYAEQLQDRPAEAEADLEFGLGIAEKAGPKGQEVVARVLANLVNLYGSMGRNEDAERVLRRYLELQVGRLGAEHREIAAIHAGLAGLLDAREARAEAVEEHARAVAIVEKAGPGEAELAKMLNNLGYDQMVLKKYAEAEASLGRALEIVEKGGEECRPYTMAILGNMKQLYGGQGRHDDAERVMKKLVEVAPRMVGRESAGMVRILEDHSALLELSGRFAEAEAEQRRAIGIAEKLTPRDEVDVAILRNNLGNNLMRQGRYDEAVAELNGALKALEKAGEKAYRKEILANLRRVYFEKGKKTGDAGVKRSGLR